jgi:imidazolonepropionase-like amidohydrolase
LLADGVEECRKAVRINLRRGAKVIKVMTSGGAASLDDDPAYQQFSDEELATIVTEAGRMGLVCAAHAVGKAGILAAIRAGFKTIQHGSYSDEEVWRLMKEHDMIYVATITAVMCVVDNPDSYPKEVYDKVAKYVDLHLAAYAGAVEHGVTCALGSDLFGGPGSVLAPGQNGRELYYAVEAGMTPLQAIEAATANGPLALGPRQAPKSGQIREGYDADFIALSRNPLVDMSIFKDPDNITHIWKGGKLVKGRNTIGCQCGIAPPLFKPC